MVGCGILGGSSLLSLITGCSAAKVFTATCKQGRIEIPLSAFAETNLRIVRTAEFDKDILLVKKPDGTFNAIYMQCTHSNYALSSSGKNLNCSLHGSSFDLDGNVITGPAIEPLQKFKTSLENNLIIIS